MIGADVAVCVVDTPNKFVACYGGGQLRLNVRALGRGWYDQGAGEPVDRLLIHEFRHQYSADRLSEEYPERCAASGPA